MKIGIDIDGVIVDSERQFTAHAILFSLDNFGEDKIIVKDKAEACKKANIDIFIDDDYNHCIKAAEAGVETLYFREINRKELKQENVTEVNNWGDIYKYIQGKMDK